MAALAWNDHKLQFDSRFLHCVVEQNTSCQSVSDTYRKYRFWISAELPVVLTEAVMPFLSIVLTKYDQTVPSNRLWLPLKSLNTHNSWPSSHLIRRNIINTVTTASLKSLTIYTFYLRVRLAHEGTLGRADYGALSSSLGDTCVLVWESSYRGPQ